MNPCEVITNQPTLSVVSKDDKIDKLKELPIVTAQDIFKQLSKTYCIENLPSVFTTSSPSLIDRIKEFENDRRILDEIRNNKETRQRWAVGRALVNTVCAGGVPAGILLIPKLGSGMMALSIISGVAHIALSITSFRLSQRYGTDSIYYQSDDDCSCSPCACLIGGPCVAVAECIQTIPNYVEGIQMSVNEEQAYLDREIEELIGFCGHNSASRIKLTYFLKENIKKCKDNLDALEHKEKDLEEIIITLPKEYVELSHSAKKNCRCS